MANIDETLWTRRDFVKRVGTTAGTIAAGMTLSELLAACGSQAASGSTGGTCSKYGTHITSYPHRPPIVNNYPDRPTEGGLLPDSITANRKYTIGFSHPAFDSGFFVATQYGAETEMRRLGINGIFTFGGGYDHPEKQISDVEDLIAQKPDGILVNMADGNALMPIMDKASDMGINVTALIVSPSKKYKGFAGPSHYDGGVATTRLMVEALHGSGNIIALDGPKGLPFSDEPAASRADILPAESCIQVAASQNTDTSRTQTTQIFSDLLAAHPKIQGVWETFIDPAIAVAQVLKNAGKKPGEIKVVGKAWVAEAKQWIEDGWIYGATLQQDVITGQQGIRLQVALLNGGKPPFHVLIPYSPITKANIATADFSTAQAPADFKPSGKIRS
jgi:ribose transport system substrate-binding protein